MPLRDADEKLGEVSCREVPCNAKSSPLPHRGVAKTIMITGDVRGEETQILIVSVD